MADPRTHLPDGVWRVERTPVRPSTHWLIPPTFWLNAIDDTSGDRVSAFVALGEKSSDYTLEEWGLPATLPWDRVWHLAHVGPRAEKAKGGTKAIVGFLAREADAQRVWLTTEVKTIQGTDGVVRALLAKHGGFVTPDPEYCGMMIRAPHTP